MNGRTPSDATVTSEEILKLDDSPDLSPEDTAKRRRRALLRRFWHSASRYWGRDGGKHAWWLTGGLLAIVLLNLASAYGMNIWNRAIFDALEQRDSSEVLLVSLLYFPLLVASVCVAVAQVYARMTTQRRWRAWLSSHLFDRWIRDGRYYQLNLISGDHPESRIPHCRRCPHRHRIAGRFRHRHDGGGAVGTHLHYRAVEHRWAAYVEVGGMQTHHPGLSCHRRGCLRR